MLKQISPDSNPSKNKESILLRLEIFLLRRILDFLTYDEFGIPFLDENNDDKKARNSKVNEFFRLHRFLHCPILESANNCAIPRQVAIDTIQLFTQLEYPIEPGPYKFELAIIKYFCTFLKDDKKVICKTDGMHKWYSAALANWRVIKFVEQLDETVPVKISHNQFFKQGRLLLKEDRKPSSLAAANI